MSPKRPGGFDIRQLQIDWNGFKGKPPVDPAPAGPSPAGPSPVDSSAGDAAATGTTDVSAAPLNTADPRPVLRLRWDFRTRFPKVLPEAVDAGLIRPEDTRPWSVIAIHQEHGRQMLGTLSELDAAMAERRKAPPTMPPPRPDADGEPSRLQRWYANLLGLYEDWFGRDAAEAFDKAVRAWHAHVEVVVDRDAGALPVAAIPPVATPPASPGSPGSPEESPPVTVPQESDPPTDEAPTGRQLPAAGAKRVIARMPVPRPLPAAVAAGHFGTDEQGRPVSPSADEVHAITDELAETLIALIGSLGACGPEGSPGLEALVKADVAKYAEDFGERAAHQLEAYCRREAALEDRGRRNGIARRGVRGPVPGR